MLLCVTAMPDVATLFSGEKGSTLSEDHSGVVLVSGASRGIGAATVRRLAAAGWDVAFCHHRDEQAAGEVEKAASELGVRVLATEVDVTDAAEVRSWFRLAEEELGPVAALVSCAGITGDRPLALLPEAEWRTVIDGLDGMFHLCRTAVFTMMKRRWGRVVTVSSVCGEYDHAPPETTRADLTETIALRRFGNAADRVAYLLSADATDIAGRVLEVPPAILL